MVLRRKTAGMNRRQKAAHRVGETRMGRDEIPELLEMSHSEDPDDRLAAARFLCPCHVRQRLEPAWEALYRMLKDPDVKVRRAAWHTLEDGGRPDDPALDTSLDRVLASDKDRQVRKFAELIAAPRLRKEQTTAQIPGRAICKERGRCDFCGSENVPEDTDHRTVIPFGSGSRLARICDHYK